MVNNMNILHNGKAVMVGIEEVDFTKLPKNLKVIGCNATGTDHLPWDYIEDKNIEVISLEGEMKFLEGVTSTAEHTMGLIIALFRQYHAAFLYPRKERDHSRGNTLRGKKLGIVGYGRVGKQVAEMARVFGMEVWVYEKRNSKKELKLLLEISDVVSIHIPLKGNEGFFTKYMFSKMSKSAYFVNTSRPDIVAPGALAWALRNGVIAGAAVDFLDDELIALSSGRNVICTNHQGGNTKEDRYKTYQFILAKVDAWIENNS